MKKTFYVLIILLSISLFTNLRYKLILDLELKKSESLLKIMNELPPLDVIEAIDKHAKRVDKEIISDLDLGNHVAIEAFSISSHIIFIYRKKDGYEIDIKKLEF